MSNPPNGCIPLISDDRVDESFSQPFVAELDIVKDTLSQLGRESCHDPCPGAVNQCGTAEKRGFPTLQPVPVPKDPQEGLGEGPALLVCSQFRLVDLGTNTSRTTSAAD
jgi:hypothetical protein